MSTTMHNIAQINSLPEKQSGATLIVALVLLILISLIGVSTLRSASVVEKMSSADYQKNITFRASESAVDVTLRDDALISQVIREEKVIRDVPINVGNAKANVVYLSTGPDLVLGGSIGTVAGNRIMITSTGHIDGDENATTTTVHGVVRTGPAF